MPLIKPGRPSKHLKLILSYDDCTPLDMLFYPSSLEIIELRCNSSHAVSINSTHCKVNFRIHLLKIYIRIKTLKNKIKNKIKNKN